MSLIDHIEKEELRVHHGLKSMLAKYESIELRRESSRLPSLTLIMKRGPIYVDVRVARSCDGVLADGGREMIVSYDVPTLMRQFDLTPTQAKKLSNKIDAMKEVD